MKEWLDRTLETWIIEAIQFFISDHVSYLMNLIEWNSFLHFLTIFFLLIEGISNRMIILFFFLFNSWPVHSLCGSFLRSSQNTILFSVVSREVIVTCNSLDLIAYAKPVEVLKYQNLLHYLHYFPTKNLHWRRWTKKRI